MTLTTTTANYLITFLTVVLLTSITTGESTPVAIPPSNGGCADSVIAFSPCLPYISEPPNNLFEDPTPQCCDVFTEAFESGEAECLCYLVRQTSILGFPLNASKILSLSDLCSTATNSTTNSSIQSVCSESPTLPPLVSPTLRPPPPPSRSVSDAHQSPPPPYRPQSPPPPSPITNPRPANNASELKPSTSEKSSDPTNLVLKTVITLTAVYLLFFVRVPVFIFDFE
uniref:non-specific lipid transfer protein GPI-anchored 25 n=1 Tax=Erigeron canadensis TaxID=72917 RepID=UPI001CB9AA03|nr:non-specific lipid transfer protein GPI-anchored 25 [Erigeron canadensis]